MQRRGIVPLPAIRKAKESCFSRAPVELLVPCRFLPKLTRTGKRGSSGFSLVCVAAHLPTVPERAVKLSDKDVEKKVREAAAMGTLVDLRVGFRDRTVRADIIADLLIGDGLAVSTAIRGMRLQGASITGELNLEVTTLRCPLALLDG